MENKIIVANLKMSMDAKDTYNYLTLINKKNLNKNIIICPSNIYLPYFLNQSYDIGLQNILFADSGNYTGEISPIQARSMGVNYVLIGHCERRTYLNEFDDVINKKVLSSIKNDLKVILCVGESLEDKNTFRTYEVIKKQIISGLNDVDISKLSNVYIAYEPIWAVGTNKVANKSEINNVIKYINKIVYEQYGFCNIKIIYGGSINADNINEISKIDGLSGFLLGEVSTKPNDFLKIIEVVGNQ